MGFFVLVSVCISSLKRGFFFQILDIFVNISNKNSATS
ncbi:hypothetical protein FEDK69T_03950 [Flavobacterium enshiense DK69]|nr:hypothetical protein FEDK69T_03950 [Flavobacterium enshiense DK69]